MDVKYGLTPKQVAVLRALGEGIVEMSPAEIAVGARLLPKDIREVLGALEGIGLVDSWVPITGRTGDSLFVLTGEGRIVLGALAEFPGTPPVGTIVPLSGQFPSLTNWLSGRNRQSESAIEIVADNTLDSATRR